MIKKKDIEALIQEEKESNFKNHFFDVFFMNNTRYIGEIRKNEILLWYSSFWLRGGYPIFHLKFNDREEFIGIKLESNPFAKFLDYIIYVLLALMVLFPILIAGFQEGWQLSIFILIMAFLMRLILNKAIAIETKIRTDQLKEKIEFIEQKNNPEQPINIEKDKVVNRNEWTLKKIIIRIFLYPLSIFILYICFTGFLPNKQAVKAFFGIAICGAYLYSDLYSIFKK